MSKTSVSLKDGEKALHFADKPSTGDVLATIFFRFHEDGQVSVEIENKLDDGGDPLVSNKVLLETLFKPNSTRRRWLGRYGDFSKDQRQKAAAAREKKTAFREAQVVEAKDTE